MTTVAVLGAGAAGLAAAWELAKQDGVRVIVLEQCDRPGGIAASEKLGENRIDVGGHRFYSKKPELVSLMREMAGTDAALLLRRRRQRIYYHRRFLDYPISLNPRLMRALGLRSVLGMGFSWMGALLAPKPETSLENFYINRFGRRLYDTFFRSYTEKVCGAPPALISPDWGRDRVRGLSIRSILFPRAEQAVPAGALAPDEFLYPPKGPDMFWTAVTAQLRQRGAALHFGARVTGFERGRRGEITAVLAQCGGETLRIEAEHVISTLPLRTLTALLGNAPEAVAQAARGLTARSLLTAAVLVPREDAALTGDDCWVYVQEPDIRMGRFQIYNNWSPALVEHPDTQLLLGFEYFCSPGDALWQMPEGALCAMAVEEAKQLGILKPDAVPIAQKRCVLEDAYPSYGEGYPRRGEVSAWLAGIENLSCAGRQGLHSYINLDAAMESGLAAARIALGK